MVKLMEIVSGVKQTENISCIKSQIINVNLAVHKITPVVTA